ncbi:hypothetical protein PVT71_02095 [Salipiger sp. H15]|uniref:Uncharacterized protein n=1 Tax=Alloyangia sp. H15 TaxID=3029062 RepID=A0AAU8AIK5_9RHOB
MVFMTPFDWAALMMRGTGQVIALQAQMAEAWLELGRSQVRAVPLARPVPLARVGICGPVLVK